MGRLVRGEARHAGVRRVPLGKRRVHEQTMGVNLPPNVQRRNYECVAVSTVHCGTQQPQQDPAAHHVVVNGIRVALSRGPVRAAVRRLAVVVGLRLLRSVTNAIVWLRAAILL